MNGYDLALLQASTVSSSRIAVIAPLYYEAVHVIVRDPGPIHSMADLIGRRIAVGPEGSGSKAVSSLLLHWHGISMSDVQADIVPWQTIQTTPEVEAAIVVVQVGNSLVHELLKLGGYRLLEIPRAVQLALDEPVFHPLMISKEHYPGYEFPSEGLTSIATTAFLAARVDTSSALVRAVLKTLYTEDMVKKCGILPAEKAAHWQGVAWHPAASKFFEPLRRPQP